MGLGLHLLTWTAPLQWSIGNPEIDPFFDPDLTRFLTRFFETQTLTGNRVRTCPHRLVA